MDRAPAELHKLYYRIGEVSEIVGVERHVLRYWETEFRSIRPQKSRRGQRIYSRRDVERLIRVKDLLYVQGFTIAGARRRLREVGVEPRGADSLHRVADPAAPAPLGVVAPAVQVSTPPADYATRSAQRFEALRRALLEVRGEVEAILGQLDRGTDESATGRQ